jgi:hypothetical protein
MPSLLPRRLFVFFLLHCFVFTGFANARNPVVRPGKSTEPVDILLTPNAIDLKFGTKATIVATVFGAAGNELHGLTVMWKLADKKFKDLVFLGPPVNNATTNSIDVVWLYKPGQKQTQVPIIALVGTASAVATITYEPQEKGNGEELVFIDKKIETDEVTISPTEKRSVEAVVKSGNRVLTDPQLDCDLSDDDRDYVAINTKTKGKISLVGLGGDLDTPTRTILLPCHAEGTSATLVIRYDAGSIDIEWTVLSQGITGDNYGRTIRNDYYSVDVTLHNRSGSDFSASLLRFVDRQTSPNISIPIANYRTVHGSIARRKLTHPRSMTLAIVEGVGTLMTGFNPFFHNVAHAKNYSQFIDILSNPLKSGLEKAWKDPYPDELSRFEENVLRDDKLIPKDQDLKVTVFVPKRAVFFTKGEMKYRDDPVFVKRKLGTLEVLGYQFQRVGRRTFTSKP